MLRPPKMVRLQVMQLRKKALKLPETYPEGEQMVQGCIFCRIVQGEIPCTKIYEDDQVLAFLDINPFSKGHTLVIPKTHFATVGDCPPLVMAALVQPLPVLASAIIQAVDAEGYNILNNNGRSAGQLIDHVHFHIIPRNTGDGIIEHGPQMQYKAGQIEDVAGKIRSLIHQA